MATAYLLSESDREAIQEMLRQWKRMPDEPLSRHVKEPLYQAPEVYVARTRSGGIPALSDEADVGTAPGPDQPGYAECDIYQLLQSGELEIIDGLTRRVHNLSSSAIAANTWILVVRDKFGKWFSERAGSGGSGITSINGDETAAQEIGVSVLSVPVTLDMGRLSIETGALEDWNADEGYGKGRIVNRSGATYRAIDSNINVDPADELPGVWEDITGRSRHVINVPRIDVYDREVDLDPLPTAHQAVTTTSLGTDFSITNVPEWEADRSYSLGQRVQGESSSVCWKSIIEPNIGNPPEEGDFWTEITLIPNVLYFNLPSIDDAYESEIVRGLMNQGSQTFHGYKRFVNDVDVGIEDEDDQATLWVYGVFNLTGTGRVLPLNQSDDASQMDVTASRIFVRGKETIEARGQHIDINAFCTDANHGGTISYPMISITGKHDDVNVGAAIRLQVTETGVENPELPSAIFELRGFDYYDLRSQAGELATVSGAVCGLLTSDNAPVIGMGGVKAKAGFDIVIEENELHDDFYYNPRPNSPAVFAALGTIMATRRFAVATGPLTVEYGITGFDAVGNTVNGGIITSLATAVDGGSF